MFAEAKGGGFANVQGNVAEPEELHKTRGFHRR